MGTRAATVSAAETLLPAPPRIHAIDIGSEEARLRCGDVVGVARQCPDDAVILGLRRFNVEHRWRLCRREKSKKARDHDDLGPICAPSRARTVDPLIKSQLLYQLS